MRPAKFVVVALLALVVSEFPERRASATALRGIAVEARPTALLPRAAAYGAAARGRADVEAGTVQVAGSPQQSASSTATPPLGPASVGAEVPSVRFSAEVDCEGWNTPVFFTTASVAVVTACLDAGASPTVRTNSGYVATQFGSGGYTPLHLASAFSDNAAVVEALLAAGADVAARATWDRYTPLHLASASSNHPEVYRLLLEFWAGSVPPLHASVSQESAAVVEALLAAGADVAARGTAAQTPLHLAAASNRNAAVVEALLAAGADVVVRNNNDQTPLHLAAESNENAAVVEALLAAGTEIRVRNAAGDTPLHSAASGNDNVAVVEALLAAGADVAARNI